VSAVSAGRQPDVIVCGAGVAGMACAVRLAQAGVRVLVLETRKKLGGRASSFIDPRTGEELDNCQHVALSCCTSYLDLLTRLGRGDAMTWHPQLHWAERGGRVSTVTPTRWLPAPAHMTLSLLGAHFLNAEELTLLGIGSARVLTASRERWRGKSFAQLLTWADQPETLIAKFWEPVVVSACNLSCARTCAATALKVFQEGLLAGPQAGQMGVPRVPLGALYDEFAPLVQRAGGQVELGESVLRVRHEPGGACVELEGGRVLRAGRVVCALPFERAATVLDEPEWTGRGAQLAGLAALGHSPILGVHIEMDRPVLALPHAVLVGAGTQWVFRKDLAGQRVHAVISGADAWMGLSQEQIVARVVDDLRAYFPSRAADAQVVSARAVKERRATFVAAPGFERLRPSVIDAARPGACVLLAGDYCDVGWPATMEGATRAGYAAASAVLGADVRVPDLRPPALLRALSALW